MILAQRPHLQGLVLGALMLGVAAAGLPAAVDAARDLADMPAPPVGKVASPDLTPKPDPTPKTVAPDRTAPDGPELLITLAGR